MRIARFARRFAPRVVLAWLLVAVMTTHGSAQVPAEVRGTITGAETGRPVAGARVDVARDDGGGADQVASAFDGTFVLRGLEPRTYVVHVRAIGFAPYDTSVDVANGRAVTLDVALRRAATDLAPVLVAARRDSAARGATTFDRAAIVASGRHDVGELLQAAPGVVVTRMGGPGSPAELSIRGSDPSEVLVLVDGVPINSPITGVADLSRLSLETIDRVTVLPGAQSARYGSRALAGVVLIETRRATRDASATLERGAWDEQEAGFSLGDATTSSGTHGAVLGGLIGAERNTVRGDFPYAIPAVRGGGEATRLNADVASSSATGAATLDAGTSGARVNVDWETTSRGTPGSIVQPSLTGRETDDRLAAGADGHTMLGPLSLVASTGVDHEHTHFVDPSPPFGGAYDDSVDATQLRAALTASAADALGTLSAGAESRFLDLSSTMLAPGSPTSQRFTGAWTSAHTAHAFGVGVVGDADVSARLDWDSLLGNAVASPRAALTATRGVASLSASLGDGFSPPSLADEFFREGVDVRPNPSLQPERVTGETELRAAVRDARVGPLDVSADAAAFHSEVHGMILWQPNFQFVWRPSNFDVHRSGWDASSRVSLPAAGVDVQGTLNGDAVAYAGPVLSGQVAYRPRVTGTVTAGLSRQLARLQVTTRYVGSRRTVAGSSLNLLDPYWLTDAKVVVPMARVAWAVDATVGVDNLFNRPAAMLVDYPFGGRQWMAGLRVHSTASRAGPPP